MNTCLKQLTIHHLLVNDFYLCFCLATRLLKVPSYFLIFNTINVNIVDIDLDIFAVSNFQVVRIFHRFFLA